MSTVNLMTPAQAERRIKHLTGLLREQCSRAGEPDAIRNARWDARLADAKRRGVAVPSMAPGTYVDKVWLETGEVL